MHKTLSIMLAVVSAAAMGASFEDDFISLDWGTAVRREVSDGYVYTLPMGGDTTTRLIRPAYLKRALVVGGGGGGGGVIAGGGGGGGVVEVDGGNAFWPAETRWSTFVGGGAGGHGNWGRADRGGRSTLKLDDDHVYQAHGGGGGAGWNSSATENFGHWDPAATGGGGSGQSPSGFRSAPFELTEEARILGYSEADFQGGYGGAMILGCPGGGGGAGGNGGDGVGVVDAQGTGQNRAGDGGIGKKSDIRELENDWFGGGGGGGGGNNADFGGAGGLGGGGRGTDRNTPAEREIRDGENGRGGGGGGGAWDAGNSTGGGNGGSGCIILRFKYANAPGLVVSANLPQELVADHLTPAYGFANYKTGDIGTLSATSLADAPLAGYTVEELDDDGNWSAPVMHAGSTVAYEQGANLTRVTWIYDLASAKGPTAVAALRDTTTLDWSVVDAGFQAAEVTSATLEWSASPDFAGAARATVVASPTAVPTRGAQTIDAVSGQTLYVRLTAVNENGAESVSTFELSTDFSGPRVIGVGDFGSDAAGVGSSANPYRTLGKALSEAQGGDVVRIVSGFCTPSAGEAFPLDIPAGVVVEGLGPTTGVDGEDAVDSLFVCTKGMTLKNLTLCNTRADAVVATDCPVTIENVTVAQQSEAVMAGGGFAFVGACHATVKDCSFTGIRRLGVIGQIGPIDTDIDWSLTVRGSVFADCAFGAGAIYTSNKIQTKFTQFDGRCNKFNVTVEDCDFLRNATIKGAVSGGNGETLGDAMPAASLFVASGWSGRGTATMDRCRLVGNTTHTLIGLQNAGNKDNGTVGLTVANTLFADNDPVFTTAIGYNSMMLWRNCTVVNGGRGNYVARDIRGDFKNCIFDNAGPIVGYTGHSWNGAESIGTAAFAKTLVRNFEAGIVANVSYAAADFIAADPQLDAAYRPLPYSPAIDAGDNGAVTGETDLAGNPRVADNNGDGTAVVDLGCFESTFWDSPVPAVRVSAPGKLNILRGSSKTFTVSLSSVPTDQAGPYEVTISGGRGLVVTPSSFSLADAAAGRAVTVQVPSDLAGSSARLVVSAPGFASANMDIAYADLDLRVTGGTRQFTRFGIEHPLAVELVLDGAAPGSEVAIEAQVTSGTGTVTWSSESAHLIGADDHATGDLIFSAEETGVTVVMFTTSAGTFAATGTTTCEVTLVAGDGSFAVNPATGNDISGLGTPEAPFKTIDGALAQAVAGDEIRLAPGVYNLPAWPLYPHGVAIVGWKDGASAGEDDVVFDAGNAADTLVAYTVADRELPARLANLTFKGSVKEAVNINNADVTVENCFFTQTAENGGVAGAVHVGNDSHVAFIGCRFGAMRRAAAVLIQSGVSATDQTRSISFSRCRFEDGYYWSGAIANFKAYDIGAQFAVTVSDSVFERNSTPDRETQHDAFAGSAILFHAQGMDFTTLRLERCLFRQNGGASLLGVEGFDTGNGKPNRGPVITDCVFDSNTPLYAMANGYSVKPAFRNCTFVRNTTGIYNGRYIDPSFANCLFYKDGPVSGHMPIAGIKDGWLNDIGEVTFLGKNLVYDTPFGETGKVVKNNEDILDVEPMLENMRPLPYSPAVDAGDNAYVVSETDFDGRRRKAANTLGAEGATADLGAFESAYGDPTALAPILPFPGRADVIRGTSHTLAVTAGPEAEWPVTVAIAYPDGVTGPESVTLADATPVDVTIAVSDEAPDFGRIVFSIADAGETAFDLFASTLTVTVGGSKRVYVHYGETAELPVSVYPAGVPSPIAIDVVPAASAEGNAAVAWVGGKTISAGAMQTAGSLHVTGASASGVTTFTIDASVLFVESGATRVALEIVTYDGTLHVDAVNGSDEDGNGLLSSPFKTIAHALSIAKAGDSVSLAEGTYSAATGETFPIRPAGIVLTGAGMDKTTIDAGDAVPTAVDLSDLASASPGRLANLTLAHTAAAAVTVNNAYATVENVAVVQTSSVTNTMAAGGVVVSGNSFVEIKGCRFADFARRHAVYTTGGDCDLHGRSLTVTDTVFENLYVGTAPLFAGDASIYDIAITNCIFRNNATPIVRGRDAGDPSIVADAYAASAIFLNNGGHNKMENGQNVGFRVGRTTIDRCTFAGGAGNHVIGCAYAAWPLTNDQLYSTAPEGELEAIEISNSLFENNDSAMSTFYAYSTFISFYNCTLRNMPDGGFCGRWLWSKFYNCIIADCGPICAYSRLKDACWWKDNECLGDAKLYRTLVYNTEDVQDGVPNAEQKVMRPADDCLSGDPKLRASGYPKSGSPAGNASVPEYVRGTLDLYGKDRVIGTAADLGACEGGGDALVIIVH